MDVKGFFDWSCGPLNVKINGLYWFWVSAFFFPFWHTVKGEHEDFGMNKNFSGTAIISLTETIQCMKWTWSFLFCGHLLEVGLHWNSKYKSCADIVRKMDHILHTTSKWYRFLVKFGLGPGTSTPELINEKIIAWFTPFFCFRIRGSDSWKMLGLISLEEFVISLTMSTFPVCSRNLFFCTLLHVITYIGRAKYFLDIAYRNYGMDTLIWDLEISVSSILNGGLIDKIRCCLKIAILKTFSFCFPLFSVTCIVLGNCANERMSERENNMGSYNSRVWV